MKKLLAILTATIITAGMMAENKLAFTVEGPEDSYNRVRVVNNSTYSNIQCRVVYLGEDDSVLSPYGHYVLKTPGDADSNSTIVKRGTRLGIQTTSEFEGEVEFTVEYKDYPLYDIILIHVNNKGAYDSAF